MSLSRRTPDPDVDLAQLAKQVESLQRRRLRTATFYGTRDDAPYSGGLGPRVRVGELSDGTFGIERYTAAGVRQTVTWA